MKRKIRSILVKKDGSVVVIEFEDKLEEMEYIMDKGLKVTININW